MFHWQKCQTFPSLSSSASLKHSIVLLKWFIITNGPWLSSQKPPLVEASIFVKIVFLFGFESGDTEREEKKRKWNRSVLPPAATLWITYGCEEPWAYLMQENLSPFSLSLYSLVIAVFCIFIALADVSADWQRASRFYCCLPWHHGLFCLFLIYQSLLN